MLAKPEYSSPPDEVCCWPGRCGGAVAGREPSAQRTAGRGAEAKSHLEDAAGRGAVAELLARALRQNGWLAGAPQWQRYYWPGAPWRSCWPAAAGRHYDTHKKRE